MPISQGTKDFAELLYERVLGQSPAEMVAQARQQAEAERQQVEAERQQAEAERQQAIIKLHRVHGMPAPQIAEVMNVPVAYVLATISAGDEQQ